LIYNIGWGYMSWLDAEKVKTLSTIHVSIIQ
jgi:hypothetical protein